MLIFDRVLNLYSTFFANISSVQRIRKNRKLNITRYCNYFNDCCSWIRLTNKIWGNVLTISTKSVREKFRFQTTDFVLVYRNICTKRKFERFFFHKFIFKISIKLLVKTHLHFNIVQLSSYALFSNNIITFVVTLIAVLSKFKFQR